MKMNPGFNEFHKNIPFSKIKWFHVEFVLLLPQEKGDLSYKCSMLAVTCEPKRNLFYTKQAWLKKHPSGHRRKPELEKNQSRHTHKSFKIYAGTTKTYIDIDLKW
jgi:hypothetical protein